MNTFDIIGQSALINRLKIALESGRIVHSYIFAGLPGAGKRTLSNYFAKMLLCDGGSKPCNTCQSCSQVDSQNHPDLIRLTSQTKTIGVEPIRELRADIGIKPFQGSRKIYIIEKGDTMTPQAQNAFLKTLEEPPEYAVIIILADNLAGLLSTIVSRCQIIRIPGLSTRQVAEIIERKANISSEMALVFARLSEGLPGKGLDLALSQEYREMREESLKILEGLSKSSLVQAMGYIDYFLDNRDKAIEILDLMELWLRDALVLKQSSCQDIIINMDKLTYIKSLANNFTLSHIQCIIENIEDSKKMLMSHANFHLAIENLLVKIQGSGEYVRSSRSTV